MEGKKVQDSMTIMTQMIMPNDTNPSNNLMGGNLLRWMDIAGGICAGKHCNALVVTAAVDHVSFQKPVNLGDVITLKACVTRAFRTSVEVFVEVFAADIKGYNNRKCNEAYFTFVAVEKQAGQLKPVAISSVLPLSSEEQKRYTSAIRRREIRLILSGRMKPHEAKHVKALFDVV